MIYVSIIEDDGEMRESLAILLSGTNGFECVSSYADCESAFRKLQQDAPDVILLDIKLPGMQGTEALVKIKALLPETDFIMLTIHEDNAHVFEALRKGAAGYLVKNIQPAQLLKAIEEVHNGGSPMSMAIARMVTEHIKLAPLPKPLTERQRQVLQLLSDGKSYKQIAKKLYISVPAVRDHLKKIYTALHAANKAEAIKKGVKLGVVQ